MFVFYPCIHGYSILLGILLLMYPELINHPVPGVILHRRWMLGFEDRILSLVKIKNGQGMSKLSLSCRISCVPHPSVKRYHIH